MMLDVELVRAQLEIPTAGAEPTQLVTDETWKVRESPSVRLVAGRHSETTAASAMTLIWSFLAGTVPTWTIQDSRRPPSSIRHKL